MKTIDQTKSLLSLIFFVCLIVTSFAQIRLVEVDPSTNVVKIHNFGSSTIDISNYKLCVFPSYPKLNSLTNPSGSLNLAGGADVTVISSANLNATGGELGLYIDTFDFGNSNNIVDYMQWITSGNTRESVAVSAGIWSMGTTISGSITPPYKYNGTGTENGVTNWGSALSIDEFSLNNFYIYPNPSANYIHLKLPKSIREANLNIYDMLGKQVYNRTLILDDEAINISNFKSGIYLLKVSTLSKIKTKRLVKL